MTELKVGHARVLHNAPKSGNILRIPLKFNLLYQIAEAFAAPKHTASEVRSPRRRQRRRRIGFSNAVTALVFLLAVAPAPAADQEEQLAQASGCLNCHAPARRMVGPSFKAIASRYQDDPSAESQLIKKVKNGGAGVWGQIPMPPNGSQVNDAAIQTLVKWILGQQ